MFGDGRAPRSAPERVRGNTHPDDDRFSGMSTDRSEGTAVRSEPDSERSETTPESEPDRVESDPDPERLRRRLRRRADEIERREVGEAVSALDARGDLTEEQRETVRELGSALVEGLAAPPEQTLERAARSEGTDPRQRERTRSIRRLFDLGEG
jgi:hypothetical protein